MTKVLIATDKPFAPVAVKGIREIVEAQGYVGFSPASHRACDFHRTRRSINAD